MKTMKLKKGARFMARWPNTQYYYWSTLIEQAGDDWKIQFDDGTITVVKTNDLHDSPPADARNPVGRVTRSSPTKNRKRPEEIRKSPARKVRKLFTKEENIRLGAELSDVKENVTVSGAADVRQSSRERSVSVSKETRDTTHSAADDQLASRGRSVSVPKETDDVTHSAANINPSSHERSVSVSRESADVKHSGTDVRSSPFRRVVSATRENEDMSLGAADVRSSPFKRSVSVTRETEDVSHNTRDVRQSPSRASIRVTVQNENVKGGVADAPPSPSKRTITEEIRKESVTRSVTKYTESYLDRDFQRRLLKEGSIGSADVRSSPVRSGSLLGERENISHGSADVRSSPVRSGSLLGERENISHDVKRYTESYLDRDFRRRLLKEGSVGSADVRSSPVRSGSVLGERENISHDVKRYAESFLDRDFRRRLLKEGSVGSADLRPSPIRGSDSLLNERGKVTSDLKKYTDTYLDRDFRRPLLREGSLGTTDISSSPYRRSVSVTKENKNLTCGATLNTKFNMKDYEKKYLNKYPMEFGGRFGTLLLILLLPLYIMSVFVFNLVPDPTKFEVLFQKELVLIPLVAVGVIMLLFVQAVLTIVPIGTLASGPLTKLGILNVRCNGIFAVLVTLIIASSTCYLKRELAGIVVSVYSEAAVSAMLLGIIFSLILYRRAGKLPISYLNPYGSTGFKWYDFWMGQEVTPRIGKFNIKLVLHRFSLVIPIVLNVLIVTTAYIQGVEEDVLKSLMVSTVLQSLYCLHFLFHENIYLYSFLAISEGVGYMITVGFMTFPFILTITTKVILDYRLKASLTELYIAICAYTMGHLLLESSSKERTLSVRDPATSVWKMKVLPKWNPNVQTTGYMGEIIIYWAFALVAGTTYLGLFIIPGAFTLSVLSRASREYTRAAAYQASEVNTKQ